MATPDDINSTLQSIARQLGQWVAAFNGRITVGDMQLSNATTTVVSEPATTANSFISLSPSNTTAALTQRTNGLYISAQSAGASFSVSTQTGQASGTETFTYIVFNPS